MKNIVITGGAGFIGSHVVRLFVNKYPEYNIINFLGYVAVEHEVVEGNIDYIKVAKKDEKSPEGFYFDVSKIMEVAQVKFPDAKE